jgi:hypothetical protein
VWNAFQLHKGILTKIEAQIETAIINSWNDFEKHNGPADKTQLRSALALRNTWRQALQWSLRQAEESFCDFLGLRIFGESYLHAFGYLLSPGIGGRPPSYPDIGTRTTNLTLAAKAFKLTTPPNYTNLFEDDSPPQLSSADTYQLGLADSALKSIVNDLVTVADKVFVQSGLPSWDNAERDRVAKSIGSVVPAESCRTIADILNGAWKAAEDPKLWADYPAVQERRMSVLKELVLKNLELFEIERLQAT